MFKIENQYSDDDMIQFIDELNLINKEQAIFPHQLNKIFPDIQAFSNLEKIKEVFITVYTFFHLHEIYNAMEIENYEMADVIKNTKSILRNIFLNYITSNYKESEKVINLFLDDSIIFIEEKKYN